MLFSMHFYIIFIILYYMYFKNCIIFICKILILSIRPYYVQLAVCCRRIPSNKDSLHPVGCRSTDNKNTPLHVNMQGASLLSDICSADAVFIKLIRLVITQTQSSPAVYSSGRRILC